MRRYKTTVLRREINEELEKIYKNKLQVWLLGEMDLNKMKSILIK